MGIIPFIGAGVSVPFGYPMWGAFLEETATNESDRNEVSTRVALGDFEGAAKHLVETDAEHFYRSVERRFTASPDRSRLGTSPLTLLPLLAPGPVITTNFERVLEEAFSSAGEPFEPGEVIAGRSRAQAEHAMRALQQNRRSLVKLHGDAAARDSLTFTALEYELGYGTKENAGPLTQLGWLVYTNRPLLFMGCSLETDRTLRSLQNVHAQAPFLRHFALLAAHYRSTKLEARQKLLASAGIQTLWFPPKAFGRIGGLLEVLIARACLDELPRASPSVASAAPRIASAAPSRVEPLFYREPGPWPDLDDCDVDAIAERVVSGQTTLFFGAGIHPTRMLGRDFYERIRLGAGIPPPSGNRADVAQYLADTVPREKLNQIVEDLVSKNYETPSAVHRFAVELAAFRRHASEPRRLVVLTTNYDGVLERLFEDSNEPYHLFIYHHGGRFDGRFLHRAPDGRECVVLRPEGLRALGDRAAVIVKLNGGIDPRGEWPSDFLVATHDFVEFSTRLPRVLPAAVWNELVERSLLFLGHGLAEPDVRELARRLHRYRAAGGAPSWAVQFPKRDPEFWSQTRGISLIEADLTAYLSRLTAACARLGALVTRAED